MESKSIIYVQLFLRLALAAGFLSAVADRFSMWGEPGTTSVVWGNWENFLLYSNSVNSYVGPAMGNVLAIVATGFEIVFAVCLLVGYKTKIAAMASGILLLLFALAMTYSFGIKSSLDYSVWTGSAAAFLLSTVISYRFSVDELSIEKR